MISEDNENQPQNMALWPKLVRSEVPGSETRRGGPCASVLLGSLWGAVSSMAVHLLAPKTEEGLARLTTAWTTHGKYTKEKRVIAKQRAEQGRQMRAELKELETWFIDHGHLDKKWRDWFKINE